MTTMTATMTAVSGTQPDVKAPPAAKAARTRRLLEGAIVPTLLTLAAPNILRLLAEVDRPPLGAVPHGVDGREIERVPGGAGGEAAHAAELAEEQRGRERADARQRLQQLGIGQRGLAGAGRRAELGFERLVQLIEGGDQAFDLTDEPFLPRTSR
jgi:hypothetical protein